MKLEEKVLLQLQEDLYRLPKVFYPLIRLTSCQR
jgi:hypothetical protein